MRGTWPNKRGFRFPREEKPKDPDNVPETLGFPDEERQENGALWIFLARQPDRYIVIGKFKQHKDGAFYVTDKTDGWAEHKFPTLHDNVILAIAQVHMIIEAYNTRVSQ